MSEHVANAKPRLLIVLPSGCIGGAEVIAYNLLKGLDSFSCAVLTQASVAEYYDGLEIRRYRFDDFGCSAPYGLTLDNILRYAGAIARTSRLDQSNLIFAVMHNGTLFASVARKLFFLRIPLVGSILGNLSAYYDGIGRRPSRLEGMGIQACLRIPDGLIAPSQGVVDDLVSNYSARSDRVKSIYNGIDVDGVRLLAQAPIPSRRNRGKDRPWIVSVMRMGEQKDFPTLIAAFRQVRSAMSARLILIGDGERRQEIEQLIRDKGLEADVYFAGFQENPFPYLIQADVSVLSSFCEGFGVSIIEAFALGIPQVVSDCPSGPRELIEDGKNGFLVPVGDWEKMAERLILLLNDEALQNTMRIAALKRADDFRVEKMLSEYASYLSAFVAEGHGK